MGGNHEASNVLRELYYGGWVAPNIYFLGFAGVVRFRGLRIAGVSGIFHDRHYRLGHFEAPPFTEDSMRSVYHLRELEVFRLAQLSSECSIDASPVDIFLSHDWPSRIWDYGYVDQLLRRKGYFQEDIASGKLGSPPLMHLLQKLRPAYWFAAHLHTKFAALVPHYPESSDPNARTDTTFTKFLALDKVLPGRLFNC